MVKLSAYHVEGASSNPSHVDHLVLDISFWVAVISPTLSLSSHKTTDVLDAKVHYTRRRYYLLQPYIASSLPLRRCSCGRTRNKVNLAALPHHTSPTQ
jgi:hypothetical protein